MSFVLDFLAHSVAATYKKLRSITEGENGMERNSSKKGQKMRKEGKNEDEGDKRKRAKKKEENREREEKKEKRKKGRGKRKRKKVPPMSLSLSGGPCINCVVCSDHGPSPAGPIRADHPVVEYLNSFCSMIILG